MRSEICKWIYEASKLNARALFEGRFLSVAKQADHPAHETLHVERLASAVFVVVRLKQSSVLLSSDETADKLASQRLTALSQGAIPDVSDEHLGPSPSTLLHQARRHLDEEIDHASRTI
jgi:hypothetical protein